MNVFYVLGGYLNFILFSLSSLFGLLISPPFLFFSFCLLISLSHALSIFQGTKLDNQEKSQLEGNANSMKVLYS